MQLQQGLKQKLKIDANLNNLSLLKILAEVTQCSYDYIDENDTTENMLHEFAIMNGCDIKYKKTKKYHKITVINLYNC